MFDIALLGLGLGALLIGLWAHRRRLERARTLERELLDARGELTPGRDAVVHGLVLQNADLSSGDVVVSVTQHRRPQSAEPLREVYENLLPLVRGGVQATSSAAPFYLESEHGTVRVEPGTRVLIATEWQADPAREHLPLHIKVGDTLYAYGLLTRTAHTFGGYRGGAQGWLMRAPPRGRVVLATSALRDRYNARIEVLRDFVRWALPLWLGLHAIVSAPFLIASFFGTQTSINVESVYEGNAPYRGPKLETRTDDDITLRSPVTRTTQRAIDEEGIHRIPLLRVGTHKPLWYVGGEAWTVLPLVLTMGGFWLFSLLRLRVRYLRATPWYDR